MGLKSLECTPNAVSVKAMSAVDGAQPVGLLGLVVHLLVVSQEEEGLVLHERAAQRGAELVLGKVGSESGGGAAGEVWRSPPTARRTCRSSGRSRTSLVPDLVMMLTIRPSGPELRVGAVGHHHEILYRIEVERERRPLAAPLLAEERVVEVGPVYRHVVVDRAATDAELVAIGSLDRRHIGVRS